MRNRKQILRLDEYLDLSNIEIQNPNSNSNLNIMVTVTGHTIENTVLVSREKVKKINSKKLVRTPKERDSLKTNKWITRGKSLLLVLGYSCVSSLVALSLFTYTGNAKARVVLTGSMEPVISAGDIIITVPVKHRTPEIGDIVAYQGKRFDGSEVGVFSHRIIGGDTKEGFIVKGDANPSPDVQRPLLSDISGVVVLTIPFLGRLLNPRVFFILAPMLVGIWLILGALRDD